MTYRETSPQAPLIAAFGGNIVAFDRATGERKWTIRELELGGVMRLGFVADFLVVSMNRTLVAVVLQTGRIAWQTTTPFGVQTLFTEAERIVVAGGGRVACFDLFGKIAWEDELKGFGFGVVALGVPGNVVNADHSG